jgi:hypothetical protein
MDHGSPAGDFLAMWRYVRPGAGCSGGAVAGAGACAAAHGAKHAAQTSKARRAMLAIRFCKIKIIT